MGDLFYLAKFMDNRGMSGSIEILYQDNLLLVVNKPARLLVHPMKGMRCKDSLTDRLNAEFTPSPWPVHRLDSPTSGVLLCSFDKDILRILSDQFRNNAIKKTYRAIVRGWMKEEEGIIDRPLQRYDRPGIFQEAITRYKCLEQVEWPYANEKYPKSRYSLLELYPQSGRFHQIRRHLAGAAHPVIGDTSHGDSSHNHLYSRHTGFDRLLLHACSLSFKHPVSGKELTIEAPIPTALKLPENLHFQLESTESVLPVPGAAD